ncbi:MAG: hypothetical protein QM541_16100 [Flavobacterium sp.]|nr:hypothetical protein [Flavobacterium sp.]
MLQVSGLWLNTLTAFRCSNVCTSTIACASNMQHNIPASIGFSKQQQKYFITPPCNYKLR